MGAKEGTDTRATVVWQPARERADALEPRAGGERSTHCDDAPQAAVLKSLSAAELPSVSVLIPVHAGRAAFQECLSGIQSLSPAPDEAIVVLDGPADDAGGLAAAAGFRVIANPESRGPAFARNMAASEARGDILFFVDSDVVVPPDAIARIRSAFAADHDLDALFGSYDDAPAAPGFLSQYRNLLHHYVHQTSDMEASTFWGACGAIRRHVFLAAGGFDETYRRPSIEDIELGYRLKAAGRRVLLLKSLQVKHLKTWTLLGLVATDFFQRALPWTNLILRGRGCPNDLNLKTSHRASVALAGALAASLAAGLIRPLCLLVSALAAGGLLALNAPLYAFFARKRGPLFAVAAIPLHWLYYLYCGLAFAIGLARYYLVSLGTAALSLRRRGADAENDRGGAA